MNAPDAPRRRRFHWKPAAECLETRQVLSAGAGNTFAIVTGQIAAAGTPAEVQFQVDPASFKPAKGSSTVQLGIDVVAPSGSQAVPTVVGVDAATGPKVKIITKRDGKAVSVEGTPISPATIATVSVGKRNAAARMFKARVVGQNGTAGAFLTGFYLIGDVDGDGKVAAKDIKQIEKAMNSTVSSQKYKFDADANRDGRISKLDLDLARKNLGARTTIFPLITADLDPTSDTGTADRITGKPIVTLNGVASAGARISYSEVASKTQPVTTVADTTGRYTVNIPLAGGANQFRVSSVDSFGQTIAGTISPITYQPVTGVS